MTYLLDTGILLRLVDGSDPKHSVVRQAVDGLVARRGDLCITSQNLAEYWNVATRPIANNGLDLPPASALNLYEQTIQPICSFVVELDEFPAEYKRLLLKYSVVGKQVHDARLVAMMLTWRIENILTLNERNFRRFEAEGITVVTPDSIIAGDAN
jgi:predicted nucleic acid-binding protein